MWWCGYKSESTNRPELALKKAEAISHHDHLHHTRLGLTLDGTILKNWVKVIGLVGLRIEMNNFAETGTQPEESLDATLGSESAQLGLTQLELTQKSIIQFPFPVRLMQTNLLKPEKGK
jgi:hypothetical protein